MSFNSESFYRLQRAQTDSTLPLSYLPKVKDSVYANVCSHHSIILTEVLSSGNEGTIYQTNTPYVAKIFNSECCTIHRRDKVTKIIGSHLQHTNICFPISVLYNDNGQFVGYLMPRARGDAITNNLFRQSFFKKAAPHWKRIDLVRVCVNILKIIEYLHKNGILVGDISPNNILVSSPSDVFFVDTDSFQIDSLPCPTGTTVFTAPEIFYMLKCGMITGFPDFLRTYEQEYFSIATLLFMILFPGKTPYGRGTTDEVAENILRMEFPYGSSSCNKDLNCKSIWNFIWNHLPDRIKYDFCLVFQRSNNKSQFNIRERLSTSQWILELTEYYNILQEHEREMDSDITSISFDPQSLLIYPYHIEKD